MWDPQTADLSPYFRVLRYDIRGHGASGVTAGDYSIEQLGHDVLALADALGLDTFAFCGLRIRVPSLIIGSRRDSSLPWSGHGDALAQQIPGARALLLDTAHLSNHEAPRAFSAALFDFLLPAQSDARDAGLRARRAGLGAKSTAPRRRPMPSPQTFRISSRATRGARSGRGRGLITVPAGCLSS